MESTGRLAMETGTVKWFNEGSGYGFIASDDGGNELFVRGGSVVGEEPVALIAGERVEFESRVAGMGPEAVGVRRPRPERSRRLFRVPTRAGRRPELTKG